MSDSNQDDDNRSPRFTRALLGRIIAVGLFVALGTFAVIQMMVNQGKQKDQAGLESDPEKQSATAEVDPAKSKAGTNKLAVTNPAKSGTSQFKPAPPSLRSSNSGNNGFATNSFNSNKNPNGFQNSLHSPNRSSNSKTNNSALPIIKTAKPLTASTAKAPPPRYAQLPDQGPPLIGNNSGFGTQPAPKTGQFGNSINSTAKKTGDSAKKIGAGLATSANGLMRDARRQTINSIGDVPKQVTPAGNPAATNQFGTRSQNNNALAAPALPTLQKSPTTDKSGPVLRAPVPNSASFGSNSSFSPLGNKQIPKQIPDSYSAGKNLQNAEKLHTPSTSFSSRPLGTASPLGESPPRTPKLPVQNLQVKPNQSAPSFPANTQRANPSRLQNNSPFGSSRPQIKGLPAAPSQTRNQVPAMPASTARSTNHPTSRLGNSGSGFPTNGASGAVGLNRAALTKNTPGDRELEGVQAPALTVEKLSPREIQILQPAEFQILVRNVGRVSAENVTVFDQIPEGTEFLNASPEPTGVTTDRQIHWNIGSLRPGQEKRIKLQLKPTRPGEIGSVAHVTFATKASMRTLVTKPVLEITHRTNPKVMIGDDVIFDVIVQNKGDGAAKDVVIGEDVPKQLEYQDGYRELEYEIGTLMPGQSKRIQLGLRAVEIGRAKNLIFASAAGGVRAQHEIDLEVVAPNLVTSSKGPTRRYLQREVKHLFNVANKGTAKATNVDLTARLPAGLRYIRSDNRGRYDASSHAVFWSLAELGLNVDATVELVTSPVDIGSQDITFEASADLNQKSTTVQKLSVEHLVDVFFEIDDVVDPIEVGAATSYRIRVVNQGTKSATNVQMQIDFPIGLTPTSVEGNLQNQIQGQRIAFAPIGSLNAGEQIQLVVHAQGQSAGDHRVTVSLQADGRRTPVSKEESTRVYADH